MATESPLPADTGLYQSYHDIAGTRLQEKGKRASYPVFYIRFLHEKMKLPPANFFHKKSFPEFQLTIFVGDSIEYSRQLHLSFQNCMVKLHHGETLKMKHPPAS